MNPVRLRAIEESQTGIQKKVLSAVPMQEPWTVKQITSEIARSGSNPDMRIVASCLNSLCESGLIREPVRGSFIRVRIKDEAATVAQIKLKEAAPLVFKPVVPADPIDRMAAAATALRDLGKDFVAAINNLANEVEEAALAMESKVSEAEGGSAKLKQLQALLKDLGA